MLCLRSLPSCHRRMLFSQEISQSSPWGGTCALQDICLSRCSPNPAWISRSVSHALIPHTRTSDPYTISFLLTRLDSGLHLLISACYIISCHHLLKGKCFKKWKESLEIGHLIPCMCPSTQEQKVGVSHWGGEPRGGQTPFGTCPQKRIAETGNLVAQGFCNTMERPPALALRGRSQQSVSEAKTRVLDPLCAFCAAELPPQL